MKSCDRKMKNPGVPETSSGETETGPMLLDAVGLHKVFRTGFTKKREIRAVEDADFHINRSETVGVVGESGSGKTTLGLLLAGLYKPDGGRLLFEGKDLWSLGRKERKVLRKRIQVIFQHPENTFNPVWKLQKSFVEPFRLRGIPYDRGLSARHLARVGIETDILSRYPSEISGGELQRIAIARAMILEPVLLILDEPTGMLDSLTQARIMKLFQCIRERNRIAVVLLSHDVDMVRLVCNRVYEMKGGKPEGM